MKNIKMSTTPLSLDVIYQWVLDPECGGNCLFVGTVRNHSKEQSVHHLDFEAYGPMALREMEKIAAHCLENMGVKKMAIHHREGLVGITEIAVIIAVSSAHRKEAFEACQYAIDQLKKTVPIWKKEHLSDGSYWVGARP